MPRQNRNQTATATAEDTTASVGRGGKAPVQVGSVTVTASTTPFVSRRTAPIDTNPVAEALRDATDGQPYDIQVEAGREAAVVHVLRRAAQRYGKGLRLQADPAGGKITFMVGPKRERKATATAE